MRATTLFAAVTASLMGQALADFYVYKEIQYITADQSTLDSFGIFTGPPDCDAVYNGQLYTPRDDVSGNKYGIRCDGCSTAEETDVNVTELEINNEGFGHFTWYAAWDGQPLVDVDNNVVGNCHIDNSDNYDCFDALATYKGQSQIFCTTGLAIP